MSVIVRYRRRPFGSGQTETRALSFVPPQAPDGTGFCYASFPQAESSSLWHLTLTVITKNAQWEAPAFAWIGSTAEAWVPLPSGPSCQWCGQFRDLQGGSAQSFSSEYFARKSLFDNILQGAARIGLPASRLKSSIYVGLVRKSSRTRAQKVC